MVFITNVTALNVGTGVLVAINGSIEKNTNIEVINPEEVDCIYYPKYDTNSNKYIFITTESFNKVRHEYRGGNNFYNSNNSNDSMNEMAQMVGNPNDFKLFQ